jgi:hypothetical protein
MTERPRPDLDQVREALRDHDERSGEAPPEPPASDEPADDEPDDDS